MKYSQSGIYIIIILMLSFICCIQDKRNLELSGPYLGQKPPGMTPEIFAPGVVSTNEKYELNSIFSLDGNEFYYEISTTTPKEKKEGRYFYIIMVSKQVNGVWTKPEIAPFSGKYMTVDFCLSPDGNRFYFCSNRQNPWSTLERMHIWYVDRVDDGWSESEILGPPIYSPEGNAQLSISSNGTMYLRMGNDLFYSEYVNGKFMEPVNLGKNINSEYSESKPFIAPDESYLIFVRYGMPESIDGGKGMYISFRKKDGSWTPAKNTYINGSLPKVTLDGKYFFFSRDGDIYWMDAKVIEELKPEEIK
ncbi:MAG: hypothetical protein GY863_06990 [bacterium]|nr:hypothetical protein [bacterium]